MTTDKEFIDQLRDFLKKPGGERPLVPVFRNDDGSLNREKMLAEPCFADFKEKTK